MTTQTQTLAGFLLARYDEEEALARCEYFPDIDFFRGILEEYSNGPEDYPEARMMAGHIAAHDPAHVLADLAAKRAIITRYEDCLIRIDDPEYPTGIALDQAREYEDFVLPALAAPYADHADFREEWR